MDKIEMIRQEIERQMKFYDEKEMKAWDDSEQGDEDALWYQGHRKMCAKLLTFLNTLSEEPSKGLEEEIERYHEEMNGNCRYVQTARHFAKWGAKYLNEIRNIKDCTTCKYGYKDKEK